MKKRFTDADKWDDVWFGDLPSKYKLFWLYLLDKIDHAGFWKVNFRVAQFMIGEDFQQSEVKRVFSARIICINDDTWFIPKFLTFQYPNGLSFKVKAQYSAINLLKKNNCIERVNELFGNSYITVQDKDKDKDKDMDKDKDKDKDTDVSEKKPQKESRVLKFKNDFYKVWKKHFPAQIINNEEYNFLKSIKAKTKSLIKDQKKQNEKILEYNPTDFEILEAIDFILTNLSDWWRGKIDVKMFSNNFNKLIQEIHSNDGKDKADDSGRKNSIEEILNRAASGDLKAS